MDFVHDLFRMAFYMGLPFVHPAKFFSMIKYVFVGTPNDERFVGVNLGFQVPVNELSELVLIKTR